MSAVVPTPPPAAPAPRPAAGPAGPAAGPAVEARGFGFWYGAACALRDVTLAVPPAAVTAIIGPSGCGKSTFLRAINRLHERVPGARHEGDLLVEGRSVFDPARPLEELRLRVGMVFQRPNPFPRSIFDNVAYGPVINGLATRRDLPDLVERCLRDAALWDEVRDRLDAPALGLSGGQQQRLCIARALANDPGILLMDEPCSALDPLATQKVEQLIVGLKRQYAIVVVTHNLQQAARISDWTAFLDRGALVEFGATPQLFTAPAQERTEAYLTGRFG